MAKSLEILPPSPGSGLSRCKMSRDSSALEVPEETQTNVTVWCSFCKYLHCLSSDCLLPKSHNKPQMYWEDWEVWRHLRRPLGAWSSHWTLLRTAPRSHPRAPRHAVCLSPGEHQPSWVDSRRLQWGGPFPPSTSHWGSRLFQRRVVFDILPSFQGLKQSPQPLPWMIAYSSVAFHTHSSFLRPLSVNLQTRDYWSFNECGGVQEWEMLHLSRIQSGLFLPMSDSIHCHRNWMLQLKYTERRLVTHIWEKVQQIKCGSWLRMRASLQSRPALESQQRENGFHTHRVPSSTSWSTAPPCCVSLPTHPAGNLVLAYFISGQCCQTMKMLLREEASFAFKKRIKNNCSYCFFSLQACYRFTRTF